MSYPVVHFEFGAKDSQATVDFYAKLFEWKIEPVPNMEYHMAATGSKQGIQGGFAKVPEGQPSYITFYVDVPDVAAALQKAEALGAKVLMPATEVMPELTLAMFSDLEGRVVGLSRMPAPAPAPAPAKKAVKLKEKKKGKKDKKSKKDRKGKKKKK
jgi:predicted enzyme related to lactoylglutathione lyase